MGNTRQRMYEGTSTATSSGNSFQPYAKRKWNKKTAPRVDDTPFQEIFTSRYLTSKKPIKLTTINTRATSNAGPNNPRHINTNTRENFKDGRQFRKSQNSLNRHNVYPIPKYNYRNNTPSRNTHKPGNNGRGRPNYSNRNVNYDGNNYGNNHGNSNHPRNRGSRGNGSNNSNNNNNNNNDNTVNSSDDDSSYGVSNDNISNSSFTSGHDSNRESDTEMMDIGEGKVSFKRANTLKTEPAAMDVKGPATVEIENLHPQTTVDDVKMVCSRYGKIKSCICAGGYAQVTYENGADGLKAVQELDGRLSDGDLPLRVTVRKTPVIHSVPLEVALYLPSPIADLMKIPKGYTRQMQR